MEKNTRLHKKQSRRDFAGSLAKGIGWATMGLPLISAYPQILTRRLDQKLGIALVGLGNYSTNQLAPALQKTQHIELRGIVTGTKAKEGIWQKKYGIPDQNVYNYQNFDSIADNPDIDVIYVVLPNSMHAEYTIRAAKAGKHVICEKPMAITVKDCQAMIDTCKANQVKLAIGYRLHFEPHHQELMRYTREKINGKIKYVEAEFGFRIGDPNQWRLKKALAGGGAIMDVGIYCIQGARYGTGEEPIAITAREFKTDPIKFKEVDELVTWQLEFPSGAVANSTTSYASGFNRLMVSAEKGSIEIEPCYGYGGIKGTINGKAMGLPNNNHQAAQMDAFARNILDDTPCIVSGEEGLRDIKVIEAMYKSIRKKGKRVLI